METHIYLRELKDFLYAMNLGDKLFFKDRDDYKIIRVPGGWIYSFAFNSRVFVPHNDEFNPDLHETTNT